MYFGSWIESFCLSLNIKVQDEIFELKSIERILKAGDNGVSKHQFEDFATDEYKEIVRKAKDRDISDEELFE